MPHVYQLADLDLDLDLGRGRRARRAERVLVRRRETTAGRQLTHFAPPHGTVHRSTLDRVREATGEVRQSSPTPLDRSQIDGARMAWLVHSDLATAGQAKAGEPPPPLVGDVLGELDALRAKVSHGGRYVIAHEVQLVSGWTVGGMHGQLRGGQLEDQPSAAGVHMWLPQDVSEEGAVRFRIATEQDDMAAIDHVRRLLGGVMRDRNARRVPSGLSADLRSAKPAANADTLGRLGRRVHHQCPDGADHEGRQWWRPVRRGWRGSGCPHDGWLPASGPWGTGEARSPPLSAQRTDRQPRLPETRSNGAEPTRPGLSTRPSSSGPWHRLAAISRTTGIGRGDVSVTTAGSEAFASTQFRPCCPCAARTACRGAGPHPRWREGPPRPLEGARPRADIEPTAHGR